MPCWSQKPHGPLWTPDEKEPHPLGFTTQIPIRSLYLTSGSGRHLHFGDLDVELRHAPRWQLAAPRRRAGEIIRALAWLGPTEVRAGLQAVLPGLSPDDISDLAEARATMPHWMAEPVSHLVATSHQEPES